MELVFRRFQRWCRQGIFDALLETLVEVGIADEWKVQRVDSTVVRGHSQAAGVRGTKHQGCGRSRGGLASKIHLRADHIGRPIAFEVTPGQASDSKHLQPLMEDPVAVPAPEDMLGDKGYDSDDNRGSLLIRNIRPVIPSKRSRKVEIPHDKDLYKDRNRIELMIDRLEKNRRIATRYDKTLFSFIGFITLASVKLWLLTLVNKT